MNLIEEELTHSVIGAFFTKREHQGGQSASSIGQERANGRHEVP
jgi:hypothetical protein